ncbi:Hypothetical predicted protein [Scomber scombrus]|uniref:Uncharacterized protein n=1 Tax=Scomber scombrus TaxID=13677 RepID=A0AAV1PJQ0_SCOSC
MTLHCSFSQAAAALTQIQTSTSLVDKKLASYATASSEWGNVIRGLILPLHAESEKNAKKENTRTSQTRKEKKITGGYLDVKATAFIDCSSSGNMRAASEVKCSGSRAAKELSSFTRICVSVRWPCGLCKTKTGNQAE